MLPEEKELVAKSKDSQFALIGINSDGDRASLKKIVDEQKITWRNAVDVTTSGPIATFWNVSGWPTTVVIDHKGVIRYRGYGGFESILAQCVAEADAAHAAAAPKAPSTPAPDPAPAK